MSCFYVVLSEDGVVFFPLLYVIFAIVQPLCTSTLLKKMPDFTCWTKKPKKITGEMPGTERAPQLLNYYFFLKAITQLDPVQDMG